MASKGDGEEESKTCKLGHDGEPVWESGKGCIHEDCRKFYKRELSTKITKFDRNAGEETVVGYWPDSEAAVEAGNDNRYALSSHLHSRYNAIRPESPRGRFDVICPESPHGQPEYEPVSSYIPPGYGGSYTSPGYGSSYYSSQGYADPYSVPVEDEYEYVSSYSVSQRNRPGDRLLDTAPKSHVDLGAVSELRAYTSSGFQVEKEDKDQHPYQYQREWSRSSLAHCKASNAYLPEDLDSRFSQIRAGNRLSSAANAEHRKRRFEHPP